jgi:short-subunit dehydrogenase
VNCVIVGASAGLGRALADELASRGHDLLLVASDSRDLVALESDLKLRFNRRVESLTADISLLEPATLLSASAALGKIDALYVIAGTFLDDEMPPILDEQLRRLIEVNFKAPLRIINSFLPELERNGALICVVTSIAVSRPRANSAVYAASKAGLDFYTRALAHKLAGSNCSVHLYRAGYLRTAMTAGKQLMLPALDPAAAASKIVARAARDHGRGAFKVWFIPGWWRLVMLVYKSLPWALYKRIRIR